MSIRRSLTISDENDIRIQHARSRCLLKTPPEDVDYTEMVNRLLAYALQRNDVFKSNGQIGNYV